MSTFISLKFWFSMYPGPLSSISIKLFISLLVVLMIAGLLTKYLIAKSDERLHRRLYRKFSSLFVTDIFLLMVMFFLMYEMVPFLASRFWFLVLIVINIIWLFFIYKFYKTIPHEKEAIIKSKEFKKYLP